MKIKYVALIELAMLTFWSGITSAQIVVYDTTGGGSYNAVGPVYNSPEFIGDRFTTSASGYLYSINIPLDNDFAGPLANGTVTLWSDAGNVVGTPLFSSSVSATNFPWSSTQLPPFTVISASGSNLFLKAGTSYWLTLSQTNGSGGLVCFSDVNEASDESVYFQNDVIQYATGLQPIVVQVSVISPPQLTIIPYSPNVILIWPTNETGFILQTSTNLGSAAVWTNFSSGPVIIGGQNVVIDAISGTQRFYQLRH